MKMEWKWPTENPKQHMGPSKRCLLSEHKMASPPETWGLSAATGVGRGANGCPRGIMGNSGDSIPTTVIMPPVVGNAFQCQWEPRPGCQNPHAMSSDNKPHYKKFSQATTISSVVWPSEMPCLAALHPWTFTALQSTQAPPP